MFRVYMIVGYAVSLILGGYICFKWLFPMIGQWIVDLNLKLQNRIVKLKADEDKWKKEQVKKFEDDQCVIDGLYMNQSEIESTYKRRWVQEEQGSNKKLKTDV